ncbi:uncharacterized protein LOC135389425 [Ornithodoros turicata]|uniref:uncharacterized protein LOC135389425 n=1 Tax=Ornithodoros turicata TaxID=34597 RepID=UPI0031388936
MAVMFALINVAIYVIISFPSKSATQKEKAANVRTAKNRSLKQILERHSRGSDRSSDEEVDALRKENRDLREQLRKTQDLLEKERALCHELHATLLKKFDIVPSTYTCARCARPEPTATTSAFRDLSTALRLVAADEEGHNADSNETGISERWISCGGH